MLGIRRVRIQSVVCRACKYIQVQNRCRYRCIDAFSRWFVTVDMYEKMIASFVLFSFVSVGDDVAECVLLL